MSPDSLTGRAADRIPQSPLQEQEPNVSSTMALGSPSNSESLDDQPLACTEPGCGKFFRSETRKNKRAALKRHIREQHLPIKALQCHHCSCSYKRTGDLYNHMEKAHPEFKATYSQVQGFSREETQKRRVSRKRKTLESVPEL